MRYMLILPLLFMSCMASAEDVSRDVPAFNTIRSRSAFNVTVEVGKAQSITIRGNEKFTGKVVTEVFGNELLISYKEKNSVRIADDAQIIITVPELNSFKMEGAGVTRLKNINANDFSISYEGAGKLVASGKARALHLAARGIGVVDTKELLAERVDANIEGVGAVSVFARDKLNASVQGIGSLTYYGNPRSVSKSVEGIGSIKAGD